MNLRSGQKEGHRQNWDRERKGWEWCKYSVLMYEILKNKNKALKYSTLYLLFIAFICFSVLGSILNSLCVFTSMLTTKLQLYFYQIYLFIIYLFFLKELIDVIIDARKSEICLVRCAGDSSGRAWNPMLQTELEGYLQRDSLLSWGMFFF